RPRAERWPSRRWPRSRGPRRHQLATRTSTLVLVACALALLCAAPAGAVVGGHTATRDTRWMAALEYKGDFVCGGSVLRPGWVLTVGGPDCSSSYGSDFDPLVMVCAGRLQGGAATCQGDSGGPLIVPGPLLVGSVSFGTGCGLATQYGVYGRVADRELRTWIEGHLPSAGAAPAPSGGGSPGSPSTPTGAATHITLRLTRVRPGARRVVVRVSSSAAVHGVRVSLRRGHATVATRRLARLSGTRRVTLRARHALRSTTYRITVTA